jgi:glycosyltransferase involved in cell wall biosynthesis
LESLACGTRVISTIESGGVVEIAKQAVEGGLIVTSSTSSFINEMLRVERNPIKKIKESLLPDMYHIESSILIIERLIEC